MDDPEDFDICNVIQFLNTDEHRFVVKVQSDEIVQKLWRRSANKDFVSWVDQKSKKNRSLWLPQIVFLQCFDIFYPLL